MSIYVSPQGVTHAVEKVYIGIQGIAQELESIYAGVSGIARVVFKRFSFKKYTGEIEGVTEARSVCGVASVGKYALFAGGNLSSYSTAAIVEAYDDTLTKSRADNLQSARDNVSGATVGDYALFAGGSSYYWDKSNPFNQFWNYSTYSAVDAYDSSLVHSKPDGMTAAKRFHCSGTVGNYALFSGGYKSTNVCAYNTSLTRISVTGLSVARCSMGVATVGKYVLFAGGGNDGTNCATVDAYDTELTRVSAPDLGQKKDTFAGVGTANYALFAGGINSSSVYNDIELYDKTLTKCDTSAVLLAPAARLSGIRVKDHAVFAGGQTSNTYVRTVNIFDRNLTLTQGEDLTEAHSTGNGQNENGNAAIAGKYVVFACGVGDGGARCTGVDAYAI